MKLLFLVLILTFVGITFCKPPANGKSDQETGLNKIDLLIESEDEAGDQKRPIPRPPPPKPPKPTAPKPTPQRQTPQKQTPTKKGQQGTTKKQSGRSTTKPTRPRHDTATPPKKECITCPYNCAWKIECCKPKKCGYDAKMKECLCQ